MHFKMLITIINTLERQKICKSLPEKIKEYIISKK